MPTPDFSPAAERNKQPILEAMRQSLPECGRALEIASGTGQHAAWFAAALPDWTWQPTEARPEALDSIAAWAAQQGAANVLAPRLLDVTAPRWLDEDARFALVFCANLLHIAPWAACAGLMRGSARHLAPGGRLVTYGPYLESGVVTSPGNLAFDQSLRAQNPAWGLRHLEDVAQEAARAGLRLAARHALPANNLLLVWAPQGE